MRGGSDKIISSANVASYSERKTGWDVYSLFFDPVPMLVMRNNNQKHDKYDDQNDWHSTLSWRKGASLTHAVTLTLGLLQKWGAFRGLTSRQRKAVMGQAIKVVPPIVEGVSYKLWDLNIRRVRDVRPSSRKYRPMVIALSQAVDKISQLKGNDHPNPMFGSKILHFLIPEFFPVWDNEIIDKKCLSQVDRPVCPHLVNESLKGTAGREYAQYLNLFLSDLAEVSRAEYFQAEMSCLNRVDPGAKRCVRDVIGYHYDDLSSTVFEICLMGKYL